MTKHRYGLQCSKQHHYDLQCLKKKQLSPFTLPMSSIITTALHSGSSLINTRYDIPNQQHYDHNEQLSKQSHNNNNMKNKKKNNSYNYSTMSTPSSYCGSIPKTIQIDTIRCFSDNNCYVLRDEQGYITLVDPAEPKKVIAGLLALQIDLSDPSTAQKTQILTTHHHWDHAGGNDYFAKTFGKNLVGILGGEHDELPDCTRQLTNGETFTHGSYTFTAHHTPCHTRGHVCYYFTKTVGDDGDEKEAGIFTGDTLFSAGVGKFFEGTAKEMFANMTFFTSLPDNTYIYDGHEYTKSNLTYCARCEPENGITSDRLGWVNDNQGVMTHPTTIGLEKKVNIFLRAANVEKLHELREAKNDGKAVILQEGDVRQGL